MAKVSIVIPVFNQPALTKSCLAAIKESTDRDQYELIVVDNASIASTKKFLEEQRDNNEVDHLIVNEKNLGCAAALNQGIQAFTTDYLIFLHNDCIVSKQWLQQILKLEEEFEEEMAVLLPMTNYANEQTPIIDKEIRKKWEGSEGIQGIKPPTKGVKLNQEVIETQMNRLYEKNLNDFAEQIDTSYPLQYSPEISSYCQFFFRHALEDIGPFSDDFIYRGYEDKEWFSRAQKKGYECWLVKNSYVHHYGNMTSDGPGFEFPKLMQHNKQIFDEKVKM